MEANERRSRLSRFTVDGGEGALAGRNEPLLVGAVLAETPGWVGRADSGGGSRIAGEGTRATGDDARKGRSAGTASPSWRVSLATRVRCIRSGLWSGWIPNEEVEFLRVGSENFTS